MGSGTQKSIQINANVKVGLSNMDNVVKQLREKLTETKFDLSKNTSLSKLLKEYQDAREELSNLMRPGADGESYIDVNDTKRAEQISQKVSRLYRQIQQAYGQLKKSDANTFKNLFPDNFSDNIDKGTKAISDFFAKVEQLKIKKLELATLNTDLDILNSELQEINDKRLKVEVEADITSAQSKLEDLGQEKSQLQENFRKKIMPEEDVDAATGKTKSQQLREDLEAARQEAERTAQALERLTQRSLTPQESQEIESLRRSLIQEDPTTGTTVNLLEQERQVYESLKKEKQTRQQNTARGGTDVGRSRRKYGRWGDADLDSVLADSYARLQQLEDIQRRIDEILNAPAAEYQQSQEAAAAVAQQADQAYQDAQAKLEAYEEMRRQLEESAREKAEKFMAGEQVDDASADDYAELQKINQAIKEQVELIAKLREEKKKAYGSKEDKTDATERKKAQIAKKQLQIEKVNTAIGQLAKETNIDEVFKKLEKLNLPIVDIERSEDGLKQLKENLQGLDDQALEALIASLKQLGFPIEQAAQDSEHLAKGIGQIGDETKDIKKAAQEVENLKDQVRHFFSLTNTFDLFKRVVRESINTVKELDAVMTETAVVTDFTIGDMWDKLPMYSKQASKLGASIKDLYGATTLYYQQGLNSDQAMNVGIETMKMARIANMEASEATTAMTAALRGFNMEINETSATRVNDVYSELAAITAADTNQIATAMKKTASIASSANMEFETTAALLAQIIETTQEAPETAGTAMKTIIARFTEVKELFDQGLLSGEDEEGEAIDINKIDTALKKVGISLKDFLRGDKGIDDIFLELASKWDSLDLATQRYIATTAAGSRQQSRFIAMMSNYERTMELVNAANNSAGASQKQYEKTLDSMQAKLQQLKNAWDTFTMNLANNDLLKGAVDALTGILNLANSLTQALSGGNGLSKSILTFITVLGALKGGSKLVNLSSNLLGIGDIIPQNGKTLDELTEGGKIKLQGTRSILANIIGGFKQKDKEKLAKTIFDEEAFKNAASERAKTLQEEMDKFAEEAHKKHDGGAWDEYERAAQKKRFEEKKKYEKAAQGDVQAGLDVGMKKGDYQKPEVDEETAKIDILTQKMTQAAAATAALGMAFTWLGAHLQNVGFDEAGEAVSSFGSILMGLGSIAAMLAPTLASAFSAIGLSMWWLLPILAGVALAIVGIMHVVEAIHKASPEGQLEAAQEAADQAASAADDAAAAFDNLKDSLDSLDSKRDSLNNLIEGTDAWRDAVQELNSEVLELVNKYDELSPYVTRDSNGVLGIDYKKQIGGKTAQDIIDSYESNANAAQVAKTLAKIGVADRQADLDFKNYEKEVIRNPQSATRLHRESTDALAKAYAAGQIKLDENGVPKFDEWLQSNGYEGYKTISGLDTEKLYQYGKKIIANENAIEAAQKTAAIQALATADLYGSSEALVQNIDEGWMASKMGAWIEQKKTEYEEIDDADKNLYAQYRGWEYDSAAGKFFDDSGNEVGEGISDSLIRDFLAQTEGSKSFVSSLEGLNQALNSLGSKGQDIGELLSNEGTGISDETLKQYKDDINSLLEGYEGSELAKALGLSGEDFAKLIQSNLEKAEKRVNQQRVTNAAKTRKFNKKMSADAAVKFAEEQKLGRERYAEYLQSLKDIGDTNLAEMAFEQFYKLSESGASKETLESLVALTESINWNNPIEAATALRKEAENGSEATKQYAQELLNTKNSSIGASAQMKYFWQTASGADFQEDLLEILNTQTDLTGMDVLSLADDYSSLGDVLKNTGATAEGMAKALTLLGNKDLKVNQLTDAVMASLAGFDGLNSIIYETLKSLEEFDAGVDESQVADFISQASETISGNIEKGAYGNSQNKKYLDYLLGPDWDKGAESGQAYEDRLKAAAKQLEKNKDNMLSSWKDLADGKDFYGKKITEDGSNLLDGQDGRLGVSKLASGGIKLTGYEGKTTDQVVSEIAEAYNVSEQYAKMMLTDFSNYSTELMAELSSNDFVAGIEKAYSKLSETRTSRGNRNLQGDLFLSDPKKVIDKSEIEQIAKLYGKSYKEVLTAFQGQAGGEKNLLLTNFYDAFGNLKNNTDLIDELNSMFSGEAGKEAGTAWVEGFVDSSAIGNSQSGFYKKVIDYDGMMQSLSDLHIPEEARAGLAAEIMSSYAQGLEGANQAYVEFTDQFGETHEVKIDPKMDASDYLAELNRINAEAESKIMSSAIAEALGTIEVKTDDGQVDETLNKITSMDGSEPKVTVVVDKTELDQAESQVAELNKDLDINTTAEIEAQLANAEELTEETTSAVQSADTTIHIEATGIDAIKQAIDEAIPSSKTISVGVALQQSQIEVSGAASGIINIAAHADGISNSPTDHPALVSEEGPELVQTEDGAYLTGLNGPEIVNINKGDTVYTAKETKQILKGGGHKQIPRFAEGYKDAKGSGSGNGKNEEWENPFDQLYNLLREINEEIRERERIERRYEKLLESIDVNAEKIMNISNLELAQLEENRRLESQRVEGRENQIKDLQEENADLTKYGWTETNERGELVLRIDWDLIDSITDKEEGEKINDYIKELEEKFDDLEEAQDSLEEIEDLVDEIKKRGEEEVVKLEDAIKDALVFPMEQEIEELQAINQAITDSNAELLDAMQKSIDRQREQRDNVKTEEELSDLQTKLMYLRQDTSGANRLEILELEKQLEEGQQNYTDTLIDQKISALQEQNDEAAQQRERQIGILESQLEHYIESGLVWQDVRSLIETGISHTEGLIKGSQLEQLLMNEAGFKGMSEIGQMNWMNETNNLIAQALAYFGISKQLENVGVKEGAQVTFTTKDGRVITGVADKDGNVVDGSGYIWDNVYQGYDGEYYAGDNIKSQEDLKPKPKEPAVETPSTPSSTPPSTPSSTSSSTPSNTPPATPSGYKEITKAEYDERANSYAPDWWKKQNLQVVNGKYYVKDPLDNKDKTSSNNNATTSNTTTTTADKTDTTYVEGQTQTRTRIIQGKGDLPGMVITEQRTYTNGAWGSWKIISRSPSVNSKIMTAYATGGLADFTGPAWLDGTKSRPELILNQRDTQNFIQLKNVLASLLNGSGKISNQNNNSENSREITYDIDINVESMGSDYDVEQMASKIKSLINSDARYRNNNTVSLKR